MGSDIARLNRRLHFEGCFIRVVAVVDGSGESLICTGASHCRVQLYCVRNRSQLMVCLPQLTPVFPYFLKSGNNIVQVLPSHEGSH